jgi:SAM-dependent methyltransferase
MNEFWNQRFAEPGYKYGTEPNAFVRGQVQRLRPASQVLVPGDGEGRNGVWFAAQGHSVLSMDYSGVGLKKARALAEQRGADVSERLTTLCADLADWAPDPQAWDAVVLSYVHLPSAIRRSAHRRLAAGLKPGGCLILEAFHPGQLGFDSGGPKDVDMLYTLAQLRADFDGQLEELLGWEGEIVLDEGPGHQGPARVTRWVGRP